MIQDLDGAHRILRPSWSRNPPSPLPWPPLRPAIPGSRGVFLGLHEHDATIGQVVTQETLAVGRPIGIRNPSGVHAGRGVVIRPMMGHQIGTPEMAVTDQRRSVRASGGAAGHCAELVFPTGGQPKHVLRGGCQVTHRLAFPRDLPAFGAEIRHVAACHPLGAVEDQSSEQFDLLGREGQTRTFQLRRDPRTIDDEGRTVAVIVKTGAVLMETEVRLNSLAPANAYLVRDPPPRFIGAGTPSVLQCNTHWRSRRNSRAADRSTCPHPPRPKS